MKEKDNQRLWRIGLAAAATGIGYVYHAISQERSIRSKVIQDGMRIKREADRLTPSKKKEQATAEIASQVKNHENLFFITREKKQEIHRGKNGVLIDVASHEQEEHQSELPWVIYFHGGSGINTLQEREWRFVQKMDQIFQGEAVVSAILLRSFANYKLSDEAERLTRLIEEIATKTGRSLNKVYFVCSDTGAMPGLLVADRMSQFAQAINGMFLLSPWLNASFDDVNIHPEDVQYDATRANALKTVWGEQNPSLNYAKMPTDGLPAIEMINGSDDTHAYDSRWLHRRLRAHNQKSNYYQFDYMHHEFFLNNIPESQEVLEIIRQQIIGE